MWHKPTSPLASSSYTGLSCLTIASSRTRDDVDPIKMGHRRIPQDVGAVVRPRCPEWRHSAAMTPAPPCGRRTGSKQGRILKGLSPFVFLRRRIRKNAGSPSFHLKGLSPCLNGARTSVRPSIPVPWEQHQENAPDSAGSLTMEDRSWLLVNEERLLRGRTEVRAPLMHSVRSNRKPAASSGGRSIELLVKTHSGFTPHSVFFRVYAPSTRARTLVSSLLTSHFSLGTSSALLSALTSHPLGPSQIRPPPPAADQIYCSLKLALV